MLIGLVGRLGAALRGGAKIATGTSPMHNFDLRSFLAGFGGQSAGPSFGSSSSGHAEAFRLANQGNMQPQVIRQNPPPPRS